MTGFEVQREVVSNRIIFHVSGTVDADAARTLQTLVMQVDLRDEVVVDFAHVRDFPDLSVGVLTRTLALRPVQLQGLRSHQARMFEYFGIRTRDAERAYYTPEDLLVA